MTLRTTPGADLLGRMEAVAPYLVALARLVALAARIDPAVVRAMRLAFLPGSEPGLEADLWFSSLVQTQTARGLVLRADVLDALRQDWIDRPVAPVPLPGLDAAWVVLQQAHAAAPPAIRLEEEIVYLGLSGRPGTAARIEALLQQVAAAMVSGPGADALAGWVARALPRLPAPAQQTDTAAALAVSASVRLGNQPIAGARFPGAGARDWLPQILPATLARIEIGVRLLNGAVELGDPTLEGGHVLAVPKTNPVLLEVSWESDPPAPPVAVQWAPGRPQQVATGSGAVMIRTLLGELFVLRPVVATAGTAGAVARPPTQEPPTWPVHALVIGVDRYVQLPALGGCVNDALSIRDFLIGAAGANPVNLVLLLAPASGQVLPPDVGTPLLPTRANILAALDRLAQQARQADEILIYYAGHGATLGWDAGGRDLSPSPVDLSAIAPYDAQLNGLNLVLDRELNAAINRLVAAGALVTMIWDAGLSGGHPVPDAAAGNPEAPAVRGIILDPQQIDAPAVVAAYNLRTSATETSSAGGSEGSGWMPRPAQGAELIVLAAARATEQAYEFSAAGVRRGALTYFLLDALQRTPAAQAPGLRWGDLFPRIRAGVTALFADQTPVLEGRGERPVLSGHWRPPAPGFTVTVGPGSPLLALNGGELHGLGPGAQVAIYPPDTTDFAQATAAGYRPITAQIESASVLASVGRILPGEPGPVPDGARALLTRPSSGVPRLPVLLVDVPEAIAAGIGEAEGAGLVLDLAPGTQPPAVEVLRLELVSRPEWVVAKYPGHYRALTADDVIAQIPDPGPNADLRYLGLQIGDGLVQWARYRAILTRRNEDPRLLGSIQLQVLAAPDRSSLLAGARGPTLPVRVPDAVGTVRVGMDEQLLLHLEVTSFAPTPLNVVILLCSDDGNIALLYDSGNDPLPPGTRQTVGLNGPANPFLLPVNDWQTVGRYTVKAIATDPDHRFELQALLLDETVAEVMAGSRTRGLSPGWVRTAPLPDVVWTTAEVPVEVERATSAPDQPIPAQPAPAATPPPPPIFSAAPLRVALDATAEAMLARDIGAQPSLQLVDRAAPDADVLLTVEGGDAREISKIQPPTTVNFHVTGLAADGNPLPLLPPLEEWAGWLGEVVARLVQLARFRTVLAAANPASPLNGRVRLRVVLPGGQAASPGEVRLEPFAPFSVVLDYPTTAEPTSIAESPVSVQQDVAAPAPLYITLLQLGADGSITQLYPPPGAQEQLAPGQQWPPRGAENYFQVKATPPGEAAFAAGPATAWLKLFVSVAPLDLRDALQPAFAQGTAAGANPPSVTVAGDWASTLVSYEITEMEAA